MRTTCCMIPFLTIGFSLITLAGCATTGRPASVPDDWVEVKVRKPYNVNYYTVCTLIMPRDYKEFPVQGEDTYCRAFRSPTVELHLSFGDGRLLGRLDHPEGANFQRFETMIDGRKAIMAITDQREPYRTQYTKIVSVYIHRISLFSNTGVSMFANCVDSAGVEEAKRIFQTVRFP